MIVCFSGTGNSRYCAAMLADKLGDELRDSVGFIKSGIAAELVSTRPWVFVAPVYAWQMARIFADFIRSGFFGGSRDAYFVLTCGGEMGNAAAGIEDLCREKDLRCRGVMQVQMPENYVAMFSVPTAEACTAMLAAAAPLLEQAAGHILAGESFPVQRVGLLDKLKSGPINKGFYAGFVSAKKFRVTDACTGCGGCVRACPLNNITLSDGIPRWGTSCTHCMACICRCPTEAIEYGTASVGKRRYLCPEYRAGSEPEKEN